MPPESRHLAWRALLGSCTCAIGLADGRLIPSQGTPLAFRSHCHRAPCLNSGGKKINLRLSL